MEFHVTGFAVHICCMILLYSTTPTGLLVHLRRQTRSCSKKRVWGAYFSSLNRGYLCNLLHATNCMQLYSARRPSGAKTIACNDVISEMSSDEELPSLSRDSTKRCHKLQHFGLMNIFEHVWKPAIIACNNCSALHAINCTCNHGFRDGTLPVFTGRVVNTVGLMRTDP